MVFWADDTIKNVKKKYHSKPAGDLYLYTCTVAYSHIALHPLLSARQRHYDLNADL